MSPYLGLFQSRFEEEKWISDDRHEKQDNDLEMRNLMEDVDRHLRGLLRVRE